jgi:hypothetical protein
MARHHSKKVSAARRRRTTWQDGAPEWQDGSTTRRHGKTVTATTRRRRHDKVSGGRQDGHAKPARQDGSPYLDRARQNGYGSSTWTSDSVVYLLYIAASNLSIYSSFSWQTEIWLGIDRELARPRLEGIANWGVRALRFGWPGVVHLDRSILLGWETRSHKIFLPLPARLQSMQVPLVGLD